MEPVILNDIPFNPSYEQLAEEMRVRKGSPHALDLRRLLEKAKEIARPKALYRVAPIEEKGEDHVVMNGIPFHSRVLRVNLDPVHRAFPYISTCGRELNEWKTSQEDTILNYYAGAINDIALRAARDYLQDHLRETYQLEKSSYMSPGSLKDWPLTEQRALFKLLGNPEKSIGVKLSPSLMMIPSQTVSGIRFSSEKDFQNCQLCPMQKCSHRKAAYDEELYKKQFS